MAKAPVWFHDTFTIAAGCRSIAEGMARPIQRSTSTPASDEEATTAQGSHAATANNATTAGASTCAVVNAYGTNQAAGTQIISPVSTAHATKIQAPACSARVRR